MFFNRDNTKKIDECLADFQRLRKEFESLKLDVEIWYNKLKVVKNIKPVQEKANDETFNNNVLLPI